MTEPTTLYEVTVIATSTDGSTAITRLAGVGPIVAAALRALADAMDPPKPHMRAAAAERAAWTLDIARMLRAKTAVAPHLRPGYLAAADWLDPGGQRNPGAPSHEATDS